MTLIRFGGVVALAIAPTTLAAQLPPLVRAPAARPVPTYGPVGQAMAPALRGDTAASIAALRALVASDRSNADAWHRLGILLWQRAQSTRGTDFTRDRRTIADIALADSALRRAVQLEPKRAEYRIQLARYNLQSGISTVRFDGLQEMARGLELAKADGDSALVALTAAELGLAEWRRFALVDNRALPQAGFWPNLANDVNMPRQIVPGLVLANFKRITPRTGRTEYERAIERFELAERYDRANLKNSRLLYMALAEGKRWSELLEVAERRARASAFDGQARFARGVALVRLGRLTEARAAFDTAMRTLDDTERARLFDVVRILPPGDIVSSGAVGLDSATARRMPPAQRAMAERLFWAVRDPSPQQVLNELELEFTARVVEAELRWSDDDQNLRGADSDRGDIFIRYGPPDETFTFEGTMGAGNAPQEMLLMGDATLASARNPLGATQVWRYGKEELFFFDLVPGFGTARLTLNDRAWVREVQRARPVEWANVPVPTEVAELLARAARFRSGRDSVELVIATRVPADALLAPDAGSAVVSGREVTLGVRLLDDRAHVVRDSAVLVNEDALRRDAERTFVLRAGGGTHVMRGDAVEPETQRASRTRQVFDTRLPTGFTVSDMLLTDGRDAPQAASAQSWRDVRAVPRAGVFGVGEKIGLLWEIYDLATGTGADAPSHTFRVALDLQRVEGANLRALALRVRDALGRVVGQDRRSQDRFTVSYNRTAGVRATHVEYLTIDGLEQRAGNYRLTLTVRDLVSGREVTRTAEIVIK